MKLVPTIFSAALIAGMSTVAMAQGAGGDVNPHRIGRGTDANPTGPMANPELGNSAAPPSERLPGAAYSDGYRYNGYRYEGMDSSDVSGRWTDRDYHERTAPNGASRY